MWKKTTVGKSCEFFNGKAHEKCINPNGNFIVVNSKYIASEGKLKKNTNKQLFPLLTNDIVMVMSDVPDGKALAKCLIINIDNKYTLNQRIACIRSEKFYAPFLKYQLNRNPHFLKFNNSENQTNLRKSDILNCPLFEPPLAEQQSIVAKLDATFAKIDMAITVTERKQEEVDKLERAILAKEFELSGNTIKLSDICTLRNGRAYKKVELLNEGKYPVLRVGNFFTKDKFYYSDLELDDSKYCKNGDLLYAWSASFGPRIWEGEKVIYHYHIWRVDIDESVVDKWFLYHWFEFDKELIKASSGTGTTMIHVSKGSMERRKINLPSLTKQKRAATKINSAFSDIKVVRKSIAKQIVNYKVLKSAILNQELQKETAA